MFWNIANLYRNICLHEVLLSYLLIREYLLPQKTHIWKFSDQKRTRCKFLQWSYIRVYPTPTCLCLTIQVWPQQKQSPILRCTGGKVSVICAVAPKVGPLVLSPKEVCEDIAQTTGDWKGQDYGETVHSEQKPRLSWYVLSLPWSSKPSRNYSGMARSRNTRDSGNNTFDEIVNITRQMQHQSLAREFSRTIRDPGDCQICGLQCWWLLPTCRHQWYHQCYGRIPSYLITAKENILVKDHLTIPPKSHM